MLIINELNKWDKFIIYLRLLLLTPLSFSCIKNRIYSVRVMARTFQKNNYEYSGICVYSILVCINYANWSTFIYIKMTEIDLNLSVSYRHPIPTYVSKADAVCILLLTSLSQSKEKRSWKANPTRVCLISELQSIYVIQYDRD